MNQTFIRAEELDSANSSFKLVWHAALKSEPLAQRRRLILQLACRHSGRRYEQIESVHDQRARARGKIIHEITRTPRRSPAKRKRKIGKKRTRRHAGTG